MPLHEYPTGSPFPGVIGDGDVRRPADRVRAVSDLPGVWHEIDESSAVIVRSGGVLEHESFRPQVPRATLSSP